MAMRDEDIGAALTLAEGDDGIWSPPMAASACAPRDWQPLYEQAHSRAERERLRADAAEARAEELRRAEVDSRSRTGSLKWQLDKSRNKLEAAVEETREVRRAAKDALFFQAEVARLEKLLSEAGVESSRRSTIMSLRMEVVRLHEALQASEARKDTTAAASGENVKPPKAAPVPKAGKDTAGALSRENARLRKALERSQARTDTIEPLRAELRESRKETVRLNKENARLGEEAARLGEEASASAAYRDTIKSLRADNVATHKAVRASERQCKWLDTENADLRWALRASHDHKERLEARHRDEIDWLNKEIARQHSFYVRASREREAMLAPLHKRIGQLRAATVRAKDMIASLREKNARLRTEARELKAEKTALTSRVETLEAQLARLRSTRTVLSKALFGSKSERQKKPGTGRKRGQQRGAPGHGRTQRPGLGEKTERRNPPKDARVCSCCGKPYVANGERSTTVIEIEVKAHTRKIVRPRWRRGCDCASSPLEVTAPPVPRLFPGTPYGTSVWARFLFELCVCLRPLSRIAAWLADQGLPVSPGTLADSLKRFVALFEPVAGAILAHQNQTALRHADETGWRVQEFCDKGRSSRAWLWTSVSKDAVYYRGRDAGCPAPPAQIRTGPLGHPAPPLGSAPHSADGKAPVSLAHSTSTPRAAPRWQRPCSATPPASCSWSATATAPTKSWRASSAAR